MTPSGPPQVVWFKRDLRVKDHAALARATAAGPVLCVYAVELEHWQQPCTSDRQWQFVRECLLSLDAQLQSLGTALEIHVTPIIQMLDALYQRLGPFTLHSHQETGGLWTYARDRAVAAWCRDHGVRWHEYPQSGVVRPVSRRGRRFKEHWDAWVAAPLERLPDHLSWIEPAEGQSVLRLPTAIKTDPLPCAGRQKGGLQPARDLLESFLDSRGQGYGANMSSPASARQGILRAGIGMVVAVAASRRGVGLTCVMTWKSAWKRPSTASRRKSRSKLPPIASPATVRAVSPGLARAAATYAVGMARFARSRASSWSNGLAPAAAAQVRFSPIPAQAVGGAVVSTRKRP